MNLNDLLDMEYLAIDNSIHHRTQSNVAYNNDSKTSLTNISDQSTIYLLMCLCLKTENGGKRSNDTDKSNNPSERIKYGA